MVGAQLGQGRRIVSPAMRALTSGHARADLSLDFGAGNLLDAHLTVYAV